MSDVYLKNSTYTKNGAGDCIKPNNKDRLF